MCYNYKIKWYDKKTSWYEKALMKPNSLKLIFQKKVLKFKGVIQPDGEKIFVKRGYNNRTCKLHR